jgi:hypothetical protein
VLSTSAYDLKTFLATVPSVALPLARARGRGEVVGPDTDVVIESFPRCASSFAVAAFRLAQEPRATRIANHTHAPAQVLAAARLGVPTIVLTRPPEAAVLSHVIHSPNLTIAASLRGYIRFHEPLLSTRGAFVLGEFDEVISNFGAVIERLNARFGTAFAPFVHSEENLARLDQEIETDYRSRAATDEGLERVIPRPSEKREVLKAQLREDYRRTSPRLRAGADALFARMTTEG